MRIVISSPPLSEGLLTQKKVEQITPLCDMYKGSYLHTSIIAVLTNTVCLIRDTHLYLFHCSNPFVAISFSKVQKIVPFLYSSEFSPTLLKYRYHSCCAKGGNAVYRGNDTSKGLYSTTYLHRFVGAFLQPLMEKKEGYSLFVTAVYVFVSR